MMRYIVFTFGSLVILTTMMGCRKNRNKWKEPTAVSFRLDLVKGPVLGGKLSFTGGEVELKNFSLSGERVQGEDVYFEKSLGLTAQIDPVVDISELNFDVPQGNYTKLMVEVTMGGSGETGIVLNGTYTNSGDTIYPVKVELKFQEIYSLVAKDNLGHTEIVLNKDEPATGRIILDPGYWFGAVSTSMLEDADTEEVDGKQTIIINDEHNESILDEIDNRVGSGTKLIIE